MDESDHYNVHHLDLVALIELRDVLTYRLNAVLKEIQARDETTK